MEKIVTLISGTSKGIGKALVKYFIKKSHVVIGFSRTNLDWKLDGYIHYVGDVSDEQFIINLIKKIKKEYGHLDNLINNAGMAAMNHCLLMPKDTIQKILNTNIIGTFLLCREAAKLMKINSYGRIVNFSTVAVPLKIEGESIYAASKAAIVSLTQILAKELASFGITVNVIGPTPIETDLIRSIKKQKINQIIESQAIKRMGKFYDIYNIVDFFINPSSNFITGQQIFLGGIS